MTRSEPPGGLIVGLPRKQIAEQLGKSEGAVRVILHRALARIAARMED